VLRKCFRYEKKTGKNLKKTEKNLIFFEISQKNQENLKKIEFLQIFYSFAVLGLFSSERALKMLKNEPLDVEKFHDTAENEPF